jgi:hypothetical protein
MNTSEEQWRRTLVLAVNMLGTAAACKMFRATQAQLDQWTTGTEVAPERVLIMALDVVVEDPVGASHAAARLLNQYDPWATLAGGFWCMQ